MAGTVGDNVTALEMCVSACSPRIMEKMQLWQSKGSVQGVCGPQKRGEARVLRPSKDQMKQAERKDENQYWILMNKLKTIKTNCMLTGNKSKQTGNHKAGVGIWEVRLKKTTDKSRKKRNTEVSTCYLLQIYVL